jgi:DNA polymerase-3 subunit delta'
LLNKEKYYDELPWLAEPRGRLTDLVAAGRCPHSLLICGRPGNGRRHLALWLAEALLGVEPRAVAVLTGSPDEPTTVHPDLQLIQPEEAGKAIKIDQIRALKNFLELTAHSLDGRRLAIICPAERMTTGAANSLLKTLEEPPAGTVLVLITESLGQLPATIVSRCQSVRIPPPPAALAADWLGQQDAADAARLLDFAGGAPLAALKLRDAGFLDSSQQYASDLRGLQERRLEPAAVAARWHKEADVALQWLYWSLAARVRDALGSPAAGTAVNQPVVQACFRQMTQIRDLRRVLNGGINAELSIAGLLMDWYGGFGNHHA